MPITVSSFLRRHRSELLDRWAERTRVSLPTELTLTDEQLRDSLPLFLDEIIEALEQSAGSLVDEQRSAMAREHGSQRQHFRRSVSELVREYGLFFECVLELAEQRSVALSLPGLRELSRCLFAGTAEAVDQFAVQAEATQRQADLAHFGFIAHELRNPLGSAVLAWNLVRGQQPLEGRPVEMLTRALSRLSTLVDETLSNARLAHVTSAPKVHWERVQVDLLLQEAEADAVGDAEAKEIELRVEAAPELTVQGDPRLLLSALTNLVRNAVKFTVPRGTIEVRARAEESRALIEVRDQCGGLPPARAERLFEAFEQASDNRTGFGLGLAIAKQAVEAQGGSIILRNVPNHGCVFMIDLPLAP